MKLLGYDFLSKQIPYYPPLRVCRFSHQSHGHLFLGFIYARRERQHLRKRAVFTQRDIVHREVKLFPQHQESVPEPGADPCLLCCGSLSFFHMIFLLMSILFFPHKCIIRRAQYNPEPFSIAGLQAVLNCSEICNFETNIMPLFI